MNKYYTFNIPKAKLLFKILFKTHWCGMALPQLISNAEEVENSY